MRFKSSWLFLFLVIFSISTFAQTKKLAGEWSLLALKVDGSDLSIPVSKRSPKIRLVNFLSNGGLRLYVTCNNANGKYVVKKGGKFKYTPGITTMKFCGEEEHRFGGDFNKAFSKATKYRIINNVLTFEDSTGANVLTFTPASKDNQPEQN